MRRRFGLIWLAGAGLLAGVAAYLAYQAGLAAGLATKIPEAGAAPYYFGPHFYGFGFGLFPLLFFLLILFLVFRPGRHRGPWGWHKGSYGGPPAGMPPAIEERLQEWHRKAHDAQGGESHPASNV